MLIEESFDRWAELSGVTLVYEPNDDALPLGTAPGVLGVRGDIRLAGASIDGVGGALAQSGILPNGDIPFDTSESAYFGNAADNSRCSSIRCSPFGNSSGEATFGRPAPA